MKMSWLTLVKLVLSLAIVPFNGVAGVFPRGTGPDPSLAVSASLNGETYINKVKRFLIRSFSRLLIKSRLLLGFGRVWLDTVRLQGVNRRYVGRDWKCHSPETWNFHPESTRDIQRDSRRAARSGVQYVGATHHHMHI